MKCPCDEQCADNCGTLIKKGEECIGIKDFYDGVWRKHYRCLECQRSRDEEDTQDSD